MAYEEPSCGGSHHEKGLVISDVRRGGGERRSDEQDVLTASGHQSDVSAGIRVVSEILPARASALVRDTGGGAARRHDGAICRSVARTRSSCACICAMGVI